VFNRTDWEEEEWGGGHQKNEAVRQAAKSNPHLTGGRISALKKKDIYGSINHCRTRPRAAAG
jgi:hypothetical protein